MKKYIDLEEYDDSVTVGQLIQKIEADEILAKQKETEEIQSIKTEFENTYLKYVDEESIYGRELEVIKLENYVRSETTTEWNLIYYFEGRRFSFSNRSLFHSKFDTNRCSDSFSAKELKKMTKITEEEYNSYFSKYLNLKEDLEALIK